MAPSEPCSTSHRPAPTAKGRTTDRITTRAISTGTQTSERGRSQVTTRRPARRAKVRGSGRSRARPTATTAVVVAATTRTDSHGATNAHTATASAARWKRAASSEVTTAGRSGADDSGDTVPPDTAPGDTGQGDTGPGETPFPFAGDITPGGAGVPSSADAPGPGRPVRHDVAPSTGGARGPMAALPLSRRGSGGPAGAPAGGWATSDASGGGAIL